MPTGEAVQLVPPEIRHTTIRVRGISPLISHRWSDKAKKQMLDKQMKKAVVGKKAAKDPEEDFRQSLYEHPDGGYGFPSIAFKAATVRAGTHSDMKMTYLRGCFHIPGELVKITGEPEPREDMVRLENGVADIRYRAEFKNWSADIPISYNARSLALEQLVNLVQVAGFSVGVGEWRPEKNGSYGMFELASDE